MSSHENIERREPVSQSSDRFFGVVFCVLFLLIGLYPLLGAGTPHWWAVAIAAVFLVLALVAPTVLEPLNRLWLKFGELLHRITNPIILGVMFFLLITPVALVLRLLRKDLLRQRFEDSPSYWIPRDPPGPRRDSLNRQF